MERETLNLKPNSVDIFNGDARCEESGNSFRRDSRPNACKVEARRCEQNAINREAHLKKMVSDVPVSEHSARDISGISAKISPVHKNGELPTKVLPNGVNGISYSSAKKTATNDSCRTHESVEGDAWLQELERLCLSQGESDRIDLSCSTIAAPSNNISHNEHLDCASNATHHSTSNSQSQDSAKAPLQGTSSTQSSSNSAINTTNMQSTEVIDGKDGENLLDKIGVVIEPYGNENDLPGIMALITKDLSEPYSIYTYRYFIHNWPQICFKATLKSDASVFVGAIVCKLDQHRTARRGYIAMLAVHSDYRRYKIASTLVRHAIHQMSNMGCDEVVLETEVTNKAAMRLYEKFGFIKDKRLHRYYLNGVDAFRLKLWLQATDQHLT